jgi:uncharacterized protein YndB with AHSA1/START domain/ketosteroid isomerase-like protein
VAFSKPPVAQRELTLTRLFDAPRPLVFSLWTEARHIAAWWGPHGFDIPKCEADPRPGGEILIHMRGPDGGIHPMGGFYEEVTPHARIVFTTFVDLPDGTRVVESENQVTFAEAAGKTRVTLKVRGAGFTEQAKFMLGGMEAGWATSLDKLAGVAAAANGNPDAADQAAIRAIFGDRTNAMFGKAAELAARHVAEDCVCYDLPAPLEGLCGGRSALQAWLDGWAGPVSWSYSDLAVEVGGDLAIAHGIAHLTGGRTDGAEIDLTVRATIGLHRRGSAWQITHQHLSASQPSGDCRAA